MYQYIIIFSLTSLLLAADIQSPKDLSSQEISKYYLSSFDLESKENYQDALTVLFPVAKQYPDSYTINYRQGWLNYRMGKYSNAMKHYQKALHAAPSSIELLNSIALVHKAQSNWSKMESSSKKAISIDHYNYYANLNLIHALISQKKYAQAQEVCFKMLTLYPSSSEILFQTGHTFFLEDHVEKSLYYLESAWILNPYHQKTQELLNLIQGNHHE